MLEDSTFTGIACFGFEAGTTIKSVAGLVQEAINSQSFLKQQFKKVDVIYGFPDSVLVPYEFMNESANNEMLDFVYGDPLEETVKRDFVFKQHLYNLYRIPSAVNSFMNGSFPAATFTHLYSVLPEVLKDQNQNHLYVIFATNNIIVMLKKAGKLQAIQNFKYKTPEDVAYHLLNVCKSFEANVNETTLHVSGMLEKVSTLYTELYKYFLQIEFDNLPENFQYADEIKQQPAHFFSHLFAVASCV